MSEHRISQLIELKMIIKSRALKSRACIPERSKWRKSNATLMKNTHFFTGSVILDNVEKCRGSFLNEITKKKCVRSILSRSKYLSNWIHDCVISNTPSATLNIFADNYYELSERGKESNLTKRDKKAPNGVERHSLKISFRPS